MPGLGDAVVGLFTFLGPAGTLVALFAIFVVDATLVPSVPEFFAVMFFASGNVWALAPIGWAGLILAAAVGGELVGNAILYTAFHRGLVRADRMPRWLSRAMRGWINFLLVRDERIILVNRIVPAVPMVGAFIATLGWDVRRSFAYIAAGGVAKYAVLLTLAGAFGVVFPADVAQLYTLVFVVAFVLVSASVSLAFRRKARRDAKGAPDQ